MAYDSRIPSEADFRAVSMVWLRAIALAWTACWEWKDGVAHVVQCGNADHVGCKFRDDLFRDPARALEEWFNYALPFAVNFKVESAEKLLEQPDMGPSDITWRPAAGSAPAHWGPRMPWTHFQFSLVTKPEKYDEAIAIAAFVSSGPAYLFTCC